MLNTERQGGWGANGTSNPPANPFGHAMSSQPANPFRPPPVNPFLRGQSNGAGPAPNPFLAKPATTGPFQASTSTSQKRSASPFDRQQHNASPKINPFSESANTQAFKPTTTSSHNFPVQKPFSQDTPAFATKVEAPVVPGANSKRKFTESTQSTWSKQLRKDINSATTSTALRSQASGARKNEVDLKETSKFSRRSPDPNAASFRSSSPARGRKQHVSRGSNTPTPHTSAGLSDDFAEKIQRQLAKDNIRPPRWPTNPGSYSQRQAIEALRESHKAYREKARMSLIRAGLIDDPDQKRTLDKALLFRGICEDMCPEWEKITRIVEHDIRAPEKDADDNGDLVAMPQYMAKRLARSAAGQDAPLPMDVRSFAALRRTLDYLIDELIPSDDLLPSRHSFLWDRTRAIRIDFSYQKYAMTPKERLDQIYCLETIARFHVTSLHLLSQDGFAPEDFSEQQEIEQLGKTLISLIEVYDDCAQQGIECRNEAEFRGYYIVFNAHNPALMETIQGWEPRFLEIEGIKTAVCLVQSIENTWRLHGPLSPYAATELAINAAAIYFSIIATPQVSYTMACFAEIHFNSVRKSILQVIRKSYSRPRDGPKDLTPAFLQQYLRTDTEQETIDFFEKHGFEFCKDGDRPYLNLAARKPYNDARIRHSFSRDIVECKRSGRSLPQVIHKTVFEDVLKERSSIQASPDHSPEESLFVSDSQNASFASSRGQEGRESEAESYEPTPPSSPPIATITTPLSAASEDHTGTKLKTSTPIEQPPASIFGQSTTSTPREQPPASAFAQPGKDAGAQSSSSISPSTTNVHPQSTVRSTQPFSNFPDVSNSWPPKYQPAPISQTVYQERRENANTEPSPPTAHNKAKPGGESPGESTALSTTSPATPGLFSFLNKNEGKDTTSSLAAPATSPFSGLLSKKSDTSHKDGSQKLTTPESGFKPPRPAISDSGPFSGLLPQASSNKDESQMPIPPSVSSALGSGFKSRSSLESHSQPPGISLVEKPISTVQPSTTFQPQSVRPSAATAPTFPLQQASSTRASTAQNLPPKDPMGDFTRWFVCGDRGLMESQLQQYAVEHILKTAWDEFQASEKERIRKEEDQKSWAEARKYREYSLKVTYFYRWLDGFRRRRVVKRIKMEKEKARQWRLPENVAKRELEAKAAQEELVKAAKDLLLQRSRNNADEAVKMRASVRSSRASREQSVEEALLATGVFDGVRDEKAAARLAAKEDDLESELEMTPAKKMLLRSENQRRRTRGLHPLKQFPGPGAYKEGSKTAMLKTLCSGAGRDSMSMSTGSLRNSTFSSSYRSSLGYNGNRVSKSQSRVTDPYWRLKANGLVRMPNGSYLHESLALPMLQEGKRFPGFGDYGLPPVKPATPIQSPLLPGDYSPIIQADEPPHGQISNSPSISDSESQNRKRPAPDEDLATNGHGALAKRKRARSRESDFDSSKREQGLFADIASLLKRVDNLRQSTSSKLT
ncbi:actin cytoskeleton and mitosis protein [Parahypoxylon ruwenzoriense]